MFKAVVQFSSHKAVRSRPAPRRCTEERGPDMSFAALGVALSQEQSRATGFRVDKLQKRGVQAVGGVGSIGLATSGSRSLGCRLVFITLSASESYEARRRAAEGDEEVILGFLPLLRSRRASSVSRRCRLPWTGRTWAGSVAEGLPNFFIYRFTWLHVPCSISPSA